MTTFGLKMNTQKAPTSDVNLRKAVAYAFDYDALLKIYNGNAVLQTSPFPNATRGHVAVPGFPRHDPARAKEFLAATETLFDSWSGDEVVADPESGQFLRDPDAGRFAIRSDQFDIAGRFAVPRTGRSRPSRTASAARSVSPPLR